MGVEGAGPPVGFMEIAASAVGLPDFQESMKRWVASFVQHPAGDGDALAGNLPAYAVVGVRSVSGEVTELITRPGREVR